MVGEDLALSQSTMVRKKRKIKDEKLRPNHTQRYTRSMATSTRKGVFETPEILEIIIRFLPFSNILTKAQRVSRTWRDLIVQSPTIQRALRTPPDADRVVHPLGFLHSHTWTSPSAATLIPKPIAPDLPVYPSILEESYRTRGLGHFWLREGALERGTCLTLKFSNRNLVQASSARQPAWMGWFLTEPRITVAWLELRLAGHIDKDGNGSFHYPWSFACVWGPDGLTFGAVLKAAEKIRRSAPANTRGRENVRVWLRFVTEPWERRHKPTNTSSLGSGSDDDVDA